MIHSIVSASSADIGHRYVVTYESCNADDFLGSMSEGLCCNQRTSQVTYRFKKRCTIDSLAKTCGLTGDFATAAEMKVIVHRQCEVCGENCSPFAYCGQPNPYSNELPSTMLCQNNCQATEQGCRPRHIFSEIAQLV
jgi:hypothetical protein